MAKFKYTALSKSGERVDGVIEGFNVPDAVDRVKQSCDVIIRIEEVGEEKTGILNLEIGKNKLNSKAFTLMCSQFAIILRSGIPISRTVQLIADKMSDKPLKRILNKVFEDVEAGRSLSASFEDHGKKLFPPTFIETIRAGEESGNLDNAFETMHEHFDKMIKMKAKIRNALIYPAFVLVIAIAVVIVLMVKVVPTFTAIFDSYGAELPLMTRILIAISDFFRNYILIIIGVLAVLIVAFKIWSNTEQGRLKSSQLALKLPVYGNITTLNAASQFANSMSTLLAAGLTVTRCLAITAKTISNYHTSQEVGKMTGKIEEGKSLGATMREAGCMPDILTDMTAVGEETGELQGTLSTIAGYYDAELDAAVTAAVNKLEPAILVGLAVIAGFIVIAIYMAMFEMYGAM